MLLLPRPAAALRSGLHRTLQPHAFYTVRHLSAYQFSSTMAPTTTSDIAPPANPRPIVVSGPSGTGKSTLLKRLFAAYPQVFGFSVSHTTRAPRAGEQDGREYHFVTRDGFQGLIDEKAFVEHATFGGNMYGTSIKAVKDVRGRGRLCVLDIDMEGAKQVAKTDLHARFLFLAPPSLEELEKRLRGRGTEDEDSTQARLEAARRELAWAYDSDPKPHDKIIINDDLEKAYKELEGFVIDGGRFGGD